MDTVFDADEYFIVTEFWFFFGLFLHEFVMKLIVMVRKQWHCMHSSHAFQLMDCWFCVLVIIHLKSILHLLLPMSKFDFKQKWEVLFLLRFLNFRYYRKYANYFNFAKNTPEQNDWEVSWALTIELYSLKQPYRVRKHPTRKKNRHLSCLNTMYLPFEPSPFDLCVLVI